MTTTRGGSNKIGYTTVLWPAACKSTLKNSQQSEFLAVVVFRLCVCVKVKDSAEGREEPVI